MMAKSLNYFNIEYFQSAIIPVLGPRAFQHQTVSDPSSPSNNITTACELFISDEKKIACFQLRSPLVTGPQLIDFFDELIAFLKEQKVLQIVILTGMFSHEQHLIESSKFMYLANEQYLEQQKTQLTNSDWHKWESGNIIHGGGYALKLFKHIGDSLPSCVFFKYTAEGDNRTDAVEIVQQLNRLLGNVLQGTNDSYKLIVPISWNAMFGNNPTEQLY